MAFSSSVECCVLNKAIVAGWIAYRFNGKPAKSSCSDVLLMLLDLWTPFFIVRNPEGICGHGSLVIVFLLPGCDLRFLDGSDVYQTNTIRFIKAVRELFACTPHGMRLMHNVCDEPSFSRLI